MFICSGKKGKVMEEGEEERGGGKSRGEFEGGKTRKKYILNEQNFTQADVNSV